MPPSSPSVPGVAEKEFWEVWSEERAAQSQAAGAGPQPPAPIASEGAPVESAPRSPRPIGAETPEGMARLYLNLGRKDGASDSEIRNLLRAHTGVSEVPEIDVMNTHTYLNVASTEADRICAALTGKQVGERELLCERARPRR
jgi:hypothetical protein